MQNKIGVFRRTNNKILFAARILIWRAKSYALDQDNPDYLKLIPPYPLDSNWNKAFGEWSKDMKIVLDEIDLNLTNWK